MAEKTKKPDYEKQPIYWFCLLDQARKRGNHEAAERALRELDRLGIVIGLRTREVLSRD